MLKFSLAVAAIVIMAVFIVTNSGWLIWGGIGLTIFGVPLLLTWVSSAALGRHDWTTRMLIFVVLLIIATIAVVALFIYLAQGTRM